MDLNGEDQVPYPFHPMPTEETFYLFKGIKAKIVGQNDVEVSFVPLVGSILLTNERVCWFCFPKKLEELSQVDQLLVHQIQAQHGQKKQNMQVTNICGKSFMFRYKELVSHGLQGGTLVCFLGSYEEEMEIEDDEQTGVQELLEQTDPAEIVSLEKGEYQIHFDLSDVPEDQREELFNRLNDLSTADMPEEDNLDNYQGMITADNIDEDGNIVYKKHQKESDDEDWHNEEGGNGDEEEWGDDDGDEDSGDEEDSRKEGTNGGQGQAEPNDGFQNNHKNRDEDGKYL